MKQSLETCSSHMILYNCMSDIFIVPQQIRLYDTRAQRRPVYSHEFGESPISALTVTPDARLVPCFS